MRRQPRLLILLYASVRACASTSVRAATGGEDVMLLPLLLAAANRTGRSTFVELGAYDGITGSQTLLLERCHGWSGLLIEGQPQNFALLERSNRAAQKVHSAVCGPGQHTLQMSERGGTVAGMPTVGGKHYEKRWQTARGSGTVSVPCAPLPALMRRAGFSRATYLALDVEGAELLVLRTLNRTRSFPFSVVLVEASHFMKAKNADVKAFLLSSGLVQLELPRTTGSENQLYVTPELGDVRLVPARSEPQSESTKLIVELSRSKIISRSRSTEAPRTVPPPGPLLKISAQ